VSNRSIPNFWKAILTGEETARSPGTANSGSIRWGIEPEKAFHFYGIPQFFCPNLSRKALEVDFFLKK